jgi:hypothetical protein
MVIFNSYVKLPEGINGPTSSEVVEQIGAFFHPFPRRLR